MTVLAANVLTRVRENLLARRILLYSTAIVLIPTLLSSGMFISKNSYWVHGTETQEAITFRRAPELWKAVRDITPIDEAVANNPMDSAKMTDWPSNIGWALLSQRRNCAAGLRLLWAYAPQLSAEETSNLIAFFAKVFDGDADEDDMRLLKEKYLCRTLVVVPSDGLWDKPILSNNSSFKLVSQRDDRWKLFR
jgi:hypothetical protein